MTGLFSTSSLLSAARIAGAVAGFATQVLLARTLQASALGLFYSVTSLVAVAGLMAAHGYPMIAPRFLSRYREQGKSWLAAVFIARAGREAMFYATLATVAVILFALLWPLTLEARHALIAAALAIPAAAALCFYGSIAVAIRRFVLGFIPDTCIRGFLMLALVVLLLALGIKLTASNVTWLFTAAAVVLALSQFLFLKKDLPRKSARPMPHRMVRQWRREANPLIVVALFTMYFADVAILIVTPLLPAADVAAIGICLKLALLVGFAVQVAHQVVAPDLADARARKDAASMTEFLLRALAFPLAATIAATAVVALWGKEILGLFGPQFVAASASLTLLVATQLLRALFGPSVTLLTVVGAQRQNAMLTLATLVVLGLASLMLAPAYGVLGASLAVALATLFWLLATAIVLNRISGLRTDALFLLTALLRSSIAAPRRI